MTNQTQKPNATKKTTQAKAQSPLSGGNKTTKYVGGAVATIATAKIAKKAGGKGILIALGCFLVFALIGAGLCFLLGKNDHFDIVGNDEQTFEIGQVYADEGVDIKEFGINMSKNAVISTNLKKDENGNYYQDQEGTYYIEYSVKSLKFGFVYPIKKVRLITFVLPSEGGE